MSGQEQHCAALDFHSRGTRFLRHRIDKFFLEFLSLRSSDKAQQKKCQQQYDFFHRSLPSLQYFITPVLQLPLYSFNTAIAWISNKAPGVLNFRASMKALDGYPVLNTSLRISVKISPHRRSVV